MATVTAKQSTLCRLTDGRQRVQNRLRSSGSLRNKTIAKSNKQNRQPQCRGVNEFIQPLTHRQACGHYRTTGEIMPIGRAVIGALTADVVCVNRGHNHFNDGNHGSYPANTSEPKNNADQRP